MQCSWNDLNQDVVNCPIECCHPRITSLVNCGTTVTVEHGKQFSTDLLSLCTDATNSHICTEILIVFLTKLGPF